MSSTPGRPPLRVLTWLWGSAFSARHVRVLQHALARHLRIPHELVVVGDSDAGLPPEAFYVPMPQAYASTPRCRRRMQGFSRDWLAAVGITGRVLYVDLDVVIVDDITALVDRLESIVGWKVGHAGVFSGSFLLADAGALDGAWQRFAADPDGYPARLQPRGVASDQAMVNDWLAGQPPIPYWTEADGFVTYYGRGYERLEHLGVGPTRPELPAGARLVVLGSADLEVFDQPERYPWVADHWTALAAELVG